jgi:hypothetical protein
MSRVCCWKTPGCSPVPDLRLIAPPPRDELLAQLRSRLGHAVPGVRVLAERLLGADSTIDFVAIDPIGRAVLVLVGDRDDDLELVARGLAQRAWVSARLGDWTQLAPNLGLEPDGEVQVVLVCPAFGVEASAALRALGSAGITAVTYRCVQNGVGFEVLLEHPFAMEPEPAGEPVSSTQSVVSSPKNPPSFRTGLSDSDLGLTAEERSEFE